MSSDGFTNRLRSFRQSRGWSQDQLATAAGISRTGVSAIEAGRLVPSTAAALALAAAFGCRVEDLFSIESAEASVPSWAFLPASEPCRYWHALVGARILAYPSESVAGDLSWHDGCFENGEFHAHPQALPERTLVVAGCDPAVGLLAARYAEITGNRMLVLRRSSSEALNLLSKGLVHVAGVHFGQAGKDDNEATVKTRLGPGIRLLRAARWQEGLALAPSVRRGNVQSLLRARLRWIGREVGSGARHCLDEVLDGRPAPRRIAHDHRGVAEAIRNDWADIGVCVRLVSDEAGLGFMPLRDEDYDLCFLPQSEADPRIQSLIEVIRSEVYRQLVGELPGYQTSEAGEIRTAK